jgi:septal ring factor EnvC (AmiA/AmiB activator)
MGSFETPREELVRAIRDQQTQITDLTESCCRLAASNSLLRNELRRTQEERDVAESTIRRLA